MRTSDQMFVFDVHWNRCFRHVIIAMRTLVHSFHVPLSITQFISGITVSAIFIIATIVIAATITMICKATIIIAIRIGIHFCRSQNYEMNEKKQEHRMKNTRTLAAFK